MKITRRRVNKYFNILDILDNGYFCSVESLERQMKRELKDDTLEFFWCDGQVVGIGDNKFGENNRMKLIHR